MTDVLPRLKYYLSPEAQAAGCVFNAPRQGDAGFDVACCEELLVEAGQELLVPTGLYLAVPDGWVGFVKERSGLAVKGLSVHAGVIDAGYRGEVKVLVKNRSSQPLTFERGSRIAQLVVLPCLTECQQVEVASELTETDRGSAGFGSTGVKV